MNGRVARGQATVELALGTLVFVTVLLFGIHFAEVGILKLRVQQAAASALWDTTGLRAHVFHRNRSEFTPGHRIRDGQNRTPAQRARELYRDFDAITGGGGGIRLSVTRGTQLRVECEADRVAPIPDDNRGPFSILRVAYDHPRVNGRPMDGLSCTARADIHLFGAPESFMERSQGGFFRAEHVFRTTIPVCAFGRQRNGECRGGVMIAIDDWGLAGNGRDFGNEWAECLDDCLYGKGGNQAYKGIVARMYQRYKSLTELNSFTIKNFLVTLFSRDPDMPYLREIPTDERDLRFIFVGEDGVEEPKRRDSPYEKKPFHYPTREATTSRVFNYAWPATPYSERYRAAYRDRGPCFLGSKCDKPIFDKQSW